MSNRIGRVSATVLGLIAGIIHGILGIVLALAVFITGGLTGGLFSSFLGDVGYLISGVIIVVGIVVFVIALLNLIGGCIVRSSRIAGGVLMLITSIPIIIVSIAGAWTSIFMVFLLITGLMSLTAAILAFVPYSARYKQLYVERKQKRFNQNAQQYQQQQPYQQPYQPQQQPYQPQQQPQQPPAAPPPKDNNSAE
jgi:hypothetical protein